MDKVYLRKYLKSLLFFTVKEQSGGQLSNPAGTMKHLCGIDLQFNVIWGSSPKIKQLKLFFDNGSKGIIYTPTLPIASDYIVDVDMSDQVCDKGGN